MYPVPIPDGGQIIRQAALYAKKEGHEIRAAQRFAQWYYKEYKEPQKNNAFKHFGKALEEWLESEVNRKHTADQHKGEK